MPIDVDPQPTESRLLPGLLIAFTLAVLLFPAIENWKSKPTDSFPLSYYPMFSTKRAETYSAQTIYGVDDAGKTTVLPYRFAGTGGFNAVRRQLQAHVKEKRAASVCNDVATRLGRSRQKAYAGIREVRIATQSHRIDAFFAGERTPVKEKVHAVCAVAPRPVTQKPVNQSLTREDKAQPWSNN